MIFKLLSCSLCVVWRLFLLEYIEMEDRLRITLSLLTTSLTITTYHKLGFLYHDHYLLEHIVGKGTNTYVRVNADVRPTGV